MSRVKTGGKSDNRLIAAWQAAVPDHCVAVGWSADGRRLAAAAVSGPVHVFDAASGKQLYALPGHGFGTAALAWQPNGSLLATAGQDGKARLWDADGKEVAVLAGGAAWVERLAWSPDGGMLATAAGKKVRRWDAAGTQLREYADHPATVADVAWRPGAGELTVAAYGGAWLYGAAGVRRFEFKGSPLTLAWSPDGRMLAHGNQDASVRFWFADTGLDLEMGGYPTKVRELSWDSSGRFLASGGGPVVVIWDCSKSPEGSKPQMLIDGEDDVPLSAVAWQRRGFLLASARKDGRVVLWQPANKKGPLVGHATFLGSEATCVAWSPDDKLLAAAASSGTVAAYRVA